MLSACSFQPGALPRPIDAAESASDAPMIDAVIAIDASPDAASCPVDFVRFGNSLSVYKAMTSPASCAIAVSSCSALGTNVRLARLDDQAEADALYTFMDDAITLIDTNITRVVGQRHANGAGTGDDTWHDLDDVTALAFLPWGASEPTSNLGEDCMSLRDEFGPSIVRVTGADDCVTLRPYACECR